MASEMVSLNREMMGIHRVSWVLMGFLASGYVKLVCELEDGPVEKVSLPMKNGDVPHTYGTSRLFPGWI